MQAGALNHLVSVQSRSSSTDALGGQSTTWSEVKQVWAGFRVLFGRELAVARTVAPDVTHEITVRYDAIWEFPRTVATYRIVYNTRIFNIQFPTNTGERNAEIKLLASEGVNDG